MRALNGRLPQNDRLDRRISHRRMTITLEMATTWQICWSRTSWQLTWCVCVRCLGIAQWAMYYWWNNSAVLRRLNNLDPVELVKNDPDVCLYVPHAWPMSYWGVQTCELLRTYMCLLTTSWWIDYSLAMKYPRTLNCPGECFWIS